MLKKLVLYLTVLCAVNIYALEALHIKSRSSEDFIEEPSIESDSIIEGTRGKRISMRCAVNNVKHYKIFWYYKGIALTYNNIRIRNDKRISIENPTPNEWILVIDGIDTTDEGYYSCRLDNGLKKFMHLIIGVPPKFTGIHDGNHVIVNTMAGENVTLSCEALGNPQPTIYWYKNNKLVSTGAHLHLLNINGFAHSEYECVARNKVEPAASRRFRINVNFPPVLNVMYNLMYKTNKAELQVLCEISGNPINAIEWYKDNQRLVDSSEGEVIMLKDHIKSIDSKDTSTEKEISIHTKHKGHHKYVSKLRITNLSNASNGVYKCLVNGFSGDVNRTVVINDINEARISGTHQGLASSYKELEFTGSFLGRGARSNLTNLDEAYSQNLNSAAMFFTRPFVSVFSVLLILTSMLLV